ncbi:MAG: FtsX-like permease family protein [Solirubrobacterales bacterium]
MRGRVGPQGARLHSFGGLGFRSLRARPLRSALTAAGIVLGVGMVFGVLILVGTIHSTFTNLYTSIYGNTNLIVSGKSSIGSVPGDTLAQVEGLDGVEGASGSVFGVFRLIEEGETKTDSRSTLFVAGIDFDAPDTAGAETVEGREPAADEEIELEEGWADERGFEVGDDLVLSTPAGPATLAVSGIYRLSGGLDLGGYGTAAMPAPAVRELTGKGDVWDEVNVILAEGAAAEAVAGKIEAIGGRGVEVATPTAKGEDANDQLAGLDVVLYFFSGMALFVGAFLILNSFNMTVLQRIREIGTLRALGASRRRVASSVVGEALILAAIGSALGLLLGVGLAELLAATMRSLFGLPISSLEIAPFAAIGAIAVGLLATAAGALYPAARAARIPPITALTGGAGVDRRPGTRRLVAGIALFLPGLAIGGLFWFSNNTGGALAALVGVGSTMTMFVGMVLLSPFVVMPVVRLLAVPTRGLMPAEGRLASDSLRANPLRTSATAAALVVTLSVVVVNAMMSTSFIGSIAAEVDARFARDLTVQPIGYSEYGGPGTAIAPALSREIAALPEAGTVTPRRVVFMTELPGGGQPGILAAVDPAAWPEVDESRYIDADTAAAMAGLEAGGAIIGEGYSEETGIEVGDELTLEGASDTREVPVVALLDTFEASGNEVLVSLQTMADVFGIDTDSVVAVTARSAGDRAALATSVERLLERRYPGFEAVDNEEVKQRYEDEINQQFAFFNAIIAIAVVVGLLGIVNTLSMSVIERTREIGVLRALGGSRWRIRRTMLDESLLISLGGSLTGIVAGLVVGAVWITSVREATNVGIDLRIPVTMLIAIAILGVVMGTLAAVLPARRAAGLDPLQALTYE